MSTSNSRPSPSRAAALCALLGVALLGCGGDSAPASVVDGSPAASQPELGASASASAATGGQPAAGGLPSGAVLHADDLGKTVTLKVGEAVTLSLQAEQGFDSWVVADPDPAVLQPMVNPAAAAVQGVTLQTFKAIAAGMTDINATDRPHCNPGQACPRLIRAFKATVVVAA